MSEHRTIGEAAQELGISAGYLRLAERLGMAPPAARAENGYRVYGDEDLERLIELGVGRRKKRLDEALGG